MKQLIKAIIYYSGFLSLLHRIRNRDTLTILMFHRVLPESELTSSGADPEWTITPQLLDDLINFSKKNYQIISLKQLQKYQEPNNSSSLPKRALLLTFDDGWQDNFHYALPVLIKHEVSAVLHQVSDCIDNKIFLWQEQLTIIANMDKQAYEKLCTQFFSKTMALAEFILAIKKDSEKLTLLKSLIVKINPVADKMMLNKQQIEQMIASNFELSSHGKTHQKLSDLEDKELELELTCSAKALSDISKANVDSISFPHGGYNERVVEVAMASGYKTIFTSDSSLNFLNFNDKLWGRIHLSKMSIANKGTFSGIKTAYFLFTRVINKG